VAWPLEICGGELGAKAALVPLTALSAPVQSGAAGILPPQAIEEQAKAKSQETAKLKAAFESGQIGNLDGLTVKQLQTLSKQNGVSIARTKADFIQLLDQVEPGISHTDLSGAALKAKLKEHKIGLLRTKQELVDLLAEKQAALNHAQQLAEQLKKVPALGRDDRTHPLALGKARGRAARSRPRPARQPGGAPRAFRPGGRGVPGLHGAHPPRGIRGQAHPPADGRLRPWPHCEERTTRLSKVSVHGKKLRPFSPLRGNGFFLIMPPQSYIS
jgi:hypothetical protein